MSGVRDFRELACWQLANELKLRIYRFLERPALGKDFRFCDQLRDAAASAPRNIAEGFGRRTHAEFAHYLDIARGSLMESQNHLHDAVDRGHLRPAERDEMLALAKRAGGAIAALQRYLRRPQK
jgi:four helix bundle protein